MILRSTPLQHPSDSSREIFFYNCARTLPYKENQILKREMCNNTVQDFKYFLHPLLASFTIRGHGENKRTFPYCCLQGDTSHRGFPKPFLESSSTRNDWLQPQFQCCRIGSHPLVVHTSGSNWQHGYLHIKHIWLQLHAMIRTKEQQALILTFCI